MNKTQRHRHSLAVGLIIVAVIVMAGSLISSQKKLDTDSAAASLSRNVGKRLSILETFISQAFAEDPSHFMHLRKLPDDMVVYKYYDDTLHSWSNHFPLPNDDIRTDRTVIQRLTGYKNNIISPLSEVTSTPSYVNYGPKWYLVKSERQDNCLVIAGLEIIDEMAGATLNDVNSRLRLNENYILQPLSGSGSAVIVNGEPLFKVATDMIAVRETNPTLSWVALALLIIGAMLLLMADKSWGRYFSVTGAITLAMTWAYFYGKSLQQTSTLFSPILYADGPFLYSLGAVVIISLWLTLLLLCTYIIRWTIYDYIRSGDIRLKMALSSSTAVLMVVALLIYIHTTFRSIMMNSSISLEIYKPDTLSWFTGVVYLSYFSLAMTIPLLIQMMAPGLRYFFGLRYDSFSRGGRLAFSVMGAVYFMIASAVLGFRKESDRVDVWSNRLAIDRDISLEIQLRSMERAIANDPYIASFSVLDNSSDIIRNRIINNYMNRLAQDYDVSVYVMNSTSPNPTLAELFNERISRGIQIADRSIFYYSRDVNGRARYSGSLNYDSGQYGISNLLICVEAKSNREDRGYLSLLGIADPGKVVVPLNYSYAKYVSDKLVTFKGGYAYPTVLTDDFKVRPQGSEDGHTIINGYSHFIHYVADDECIVISRPKTEILSYIVEMVLFGMISYFLISVVTWRKRRHRRTERQYYRSRINATLLGALVITLVSMAGFSVYFVYRRNDADMRTIMSGKINSIQTIIQSRARSASSFIDLRTQEMAAAIEETGNTLKSDVTLYTVSGQAFMTSTPEIFERMIIGQRINGDAIDNIVNNHKRYYIHREKISRHSFFSLYAPIFNNDGEMLAIVSSPYTDNNYDLSREAFSHVVTIITVFLLLMIIARFVTTAVIAKMFRPITEMSRKMNDAEIDNLEYIIYERDDEVATLVRAYNLMVHDLSDSTRQLAQAERDKAWSEMARQVAHEIKNPLTPIKLKLQMLIRMKDAGNPAWEAKFDEVAGVVLEHIDILADTANEFSTFAKLYSEEPVSIDLDRLLRDEVGIFDGKEDIDFDYYGLDGAEIMGPKPQLTRVFVNLITNSIQALEDMREEEAETGVVPPKGHIVVSLRHSVRDGYYDIVFEDNGPGVKEENRARLFTPNFTTKSRGSGLGLAICRNIIERCKGDISYSRSFSLGGACFMIRYPKKVVSLQSKNGR
ncbi:MAG: hypothetical protein IK143_00930 [Bacteroidales bacterium]|nr:hypothetical protein [Bacteroidales bacterium]